MGTESQTRSRARAQQQQGGNAGAQPGLGKPVFVKVDQVKPGTSGRLVSQHLRQTRIAECLAGDETDTIVFTARNDQVDLMKPGMTIILRNAKIDMFKGSMRLAVEGG